MARGGARQGAGRKPLKADDPLTEWIIAALREYLLSPDQKAKRHLRWLRANGFTAQQIAVITGTLGDLHELREEIRNVSHSDRAAMIANPEGTPLEDVREVIDTQLQGRRWHRIPEPTPQEMGEAYEFVARLARSQHGIKLNRAGVERRVSKWKKAP